jgi:monoamine oxidase
MGGDVADVLVVGAGVAGLSAARDLSRAGLAVRVLEARDRMGGRIYTLHDPATSLPIELGAEFIHGRPAETWAIVRAAGLEAHEVDGEQWQSRDGVLGQGDRGWAKVGQIMERMAQAGTPDQSFAEFVAPYVQDEGWRAAAELATSYVEGFDAARAERISVRSLAREQQASDAIDGDRAFRVVGGYDEVVRALHAGCDPKRVTVHLGTVVTRVEWRPGAVVVAAQSGGGRPIEPFRAPRAIVTLPLGVLQAPAGEPGHVRFEPALPEKERALERLDMGQVVKIMLRFRERFWEARLGFLFARGAPIPTWWTAYPALAPVLTGWAGGSAAIRLPEGHEQVIDVAVPALAGALGMEPRRLHALLEGWHMHDWRADPFARGAYSYVVAGGIDAPAALARPEAGTLFFAGEATDSTGRTGTVDGAIASGRRAAREVLGE